MAYTPVLTVSVFLKQILHVVALFTVSGGREARVHPVFKQTILLYYVNRVLPSSVSSK